MSEETLAEKLGQTVRARRESMGMSQAQLANVLGHSQAWLCYIEAGKREPKLADLDFLCSFFGITFPLPRSSAVSS